MKRKLWILMALAVLIALLCCGVAGAEGENTYKLKSFVASLNEFEENDNGIKRVLVVPRKIKYEWDGDEYDYLLWIASPRYSDPECKNEIPLGELSFGESYYFYVALMNGKTTPPEGGIVDYSQIDLNDAHIDMIGYSVEKISVEADDVFLSVKCKATKTISVLTEFNGHATGIRPGSQWNDGYTSVKSGGLVGLKFETTLSGPDQYMHVLGSPIYTNSSCSPNTVLQTDDLQLGQTYYYSLTLLDTYSLTGYDRVDFSFLLQRPDAAKCIITVPGYVFECIQRTSVTHEGYKGVNLLFSIRKSCTVTFDSNGGEGTRQIEVMPGNTITLPNCGFTPPKGYEFSCWKIGNTFLNPGDRVVVNSDMTVTAHWYQLCIVYFTPGDGIGSATSQYVSPYTSITLPGCDFTPPTGYEFYRWKNEYASPVEYYNPGDTVTIKGGTVFTAEWRRKTLVVNFNSNGGTGSMPSRTVAYGKILLLPECTFTPPTGKVFDTWSLGNPGKQVTITSSTTIRALWKDQYFTVLFRTNCNANLSYSVKYGDTVTAPDPTPYAQYNMHFLGWYADEDFTIPFDASVPVTADATYYANWSVDHWCYVDFNYMGHPEQHIRTSVLKGGVLPEPETPTTKDSTGSGYLVFGGWYTDFDCTEGNQYDFSQPVTEDLNLYANWVVVPFMIWTGGSAHGEGYYAWNDRYYPNMTSTIISWKDNKAPDASRYSWSWSCLYTDAECTVPLTTEPEPSTDYYLVFSIGHTDETDRQINWSKGYGYLPGNFPVTVDGFTVTKDKTIVITDEGDQYVVGTTCYYKLTTPDPCTVTYDLNGAGGIYFQETVQSGKTVSAPPAPTDADLLFINWFTDEDCNTVFDFSTPITADITLYAGWQSLYERGTCGTNLGWSLNRQTGVLTISGTGAMANYSNQPDVPWYSYRESISSVGIGNGVTSIGRYAFYGCTGMTGVTIPDSVTSIGAYAFQDCNSLPGISIPDSVKSIDTAAFYRCTSLTSVTIPASVTNIVSFAFRGCTNLTSVTVLNPNTAFGSSSYNIFMDCASGFTLRSWNPSKAKTYAEGAGHTFESLGDIAGECGTNVTYSFNPLTGALTISGTGEMASYMGETAVPWYSYRTRITSVSIGSGVTSIGMRAFSHCQSLTSITIPNSVISIGARAFYACTRLTSVTIPNSVTSVGSYAFYYCYGLTSVTIPNSVTNIGNYAFSYCSDLTSITIPASVTSIGNYAFSYCYSLTSVTILNPDCTIGDSNYNEFLYCASGFTLRGWPGSTAEAYAQAAGHTFESLGDVAGECGTNVTYSFDPITGALTISGTGTMAEYNSQTSVPWYSYRSIITSVNIGNGVTRIGNSAFYACAGMTSVTIPDSVTSIGYSAFYYCAGLTGITIPDSVTFFGTYAFARCTSLTSFTIPDSVTSIGYGAFYGCTGLTGITVPASVTDIGSFAFRDCTGLTSVTILNPNVVFDSSYVFMNCAYGFTLRGWPGSTAESNAQAAGYTYDALPLLTLPSALTTIEEDAFQGVSALGVRIPAGITGISGNPFAGSSVQYILGSSGTLAQTFAGNNGYTFIPWSD